MRGLARRATPGVSILGGDLVLAAGAAGFLKLSQFSPRAMVPAGRPSQKEGLAGKANNESCYRRSLPCGRSRDWNSGGVVGWAAACAIAASRSITEAIDTETPTGRVMWQMIGMMADGLISERTRAGVKDAKKRGVKFGRKKKLAPAQITKARKLIEAGERVEDVAALWNVGRTALYRALA
jgi:hypothetical protein